MTINISGISHFKSSLKKNGDNIEYYQNEIKEEDVKTQDVIALFETQYMIIQAMKDNIILAAKQQAIRVKEKVKAKLK